MDILKEYKNGSDINGFSRGDLVIDTFGLTHDDLQKKYPNSFQKLYNTVRVEREARRGRNADADDYADRWWQFAKPRHELRLALKEMNTFFVSTQTSKHRFFVEQPATLIPDIKLICFIFEGEALLSVLSSRLHWNWVDPTSGRLGVGNDPVYSTRNCFDPFPFPACVTDDSNPKLRARLAELGERLDAFRKERLAAHDFLTMTGLYNVLERLRELENACDVPPLDAKEKDIHEAGLVSVLKSIHDDIDRAVFEAYGWVDLGERLIGKPGATLPSPHKSEDQEAAEEELLSRLVALNLERQAEEKRGFVRWLRPDYQIPKLGHKIAAQEELDVGEIAAVAGKPKWPGEGLAQIRIVRDLLARASEPARAGDIVTAFDGRLTPARRARIAEVLEILVATGGARTGRMGGETRYFVPR